MKTRARHLFGTLVLATVVAVAGASGPAAAGEHLVVLACDSLVTSGPTGFDLFLMSFHAYRFCRVEIRPWTDPGTQGQAILGWKMPEGYTAAWIPDVPGAIEVVGCTVVYTPTMHIAFAGPVGAYDVRFFNDEGAQLARAVDTIRCSPDAVPALPATWGVVKHRYR